MVYATLRWRAQPGWPPVLAAPLRSYALLAIVDVEANFLIVKAFQYTNITSVTLLDSASIPASVLLSRVLLRAVYTRTHLVASACVLCGFALLVASDGLCGGGARGSTAPSPLLGDLLTVAAACLYATSNVLQERLLMHAPQTEVLAAFGLLGGLFSGVQCLLLETTTLARAPWGAPFVTPLLGFAVAMFAIYSLAPTALRTAGAAAFNLHMLSSDLWAAAARAALFGGFGGGCGAAGFLAALAAVAAGLVVYVRAPPPQTEGGEEAPEEAQGLLAAGEEEMLERTRSAEERAQTRSRTDDT